MTGYYISNNPERWIKEMTVLVDGCTYYFSEFLMGCCEIFSTVLYEKYGYIPYQAEGGSSVHCFCIVEIENDVYYIDVRGITKSAADIADNRFFTFSEQDVLSAKRQLLDTPEEEYEEYFKAARILIENNPDIYCIESVTNKV